MDLTLLQYSDIVRKYGMTILLLIVFSLQGIAKEVYEPRRGDPFTEMWRWSSFSKLDGKAVLSITEGKDGKIWFNTHQGIYAYDGLNWEHYSTENTIIAVDGPYSITSVVARNNGDICVGDVYGICSFDGNNWERIFPIDTTWKWRTHWLMEASDNSLWAGTDIGILSIKNENHKLFTSEKIKNRLKDEINFMDIHTFPASLQIDAESFSTLKMFEAAQDLWFEIEYNSGKKYELLRLKNFKDKNSGKWTKPAEVGDLITGNNTIIVEGPEGNVWIASLAQQTGIYQYNPAKNKYSQVNLDRFNLDYRTHSIQTAKDGSIWIGDWGKLLKYKDGEWKLYTHEDVPIPNADVKIKFMKNGNAWVYGRNEGPYYRVDLNNNNWLTYEGLNFQCQTDRGEKWYLTPEGKAVIQDGKKWFIYGPGDGLISTPVKIFHTKSGKVWIVGSHNGKAATAYLEDEHWIKQLHPKLSWGIGYLAVNELPDGRIVFGSGSEVINYTEGFKIGEFTGNKLKWKYNKEDIIDGFNYYTIERTPDNTIWIGGNYLLKFENGKLDKTPEKVYPTNGWISYLYTDNSGNLWVSYHGKGLYMFNGETWQNYTIDDNLSSNTVASLVQIQDEVVYASTKNGISAFDGRSWTRNVFAKHFKIPLEGGTLKSDRNHNLWINLSTREWYFRGLNQRKFTTESFNRFKTICYKADTLPPETVIDFGLEEISSNGNTNISWSGRDKWNTTKTEYLEYSYRINGGEWSAFSPIKRKQFLDMESGNYLFEVRARDTDFNIDPTPASLEFVVLAPFYKRAWFIIIFSVLLGLIVFQTGRVLIRDKELKKLSAVASETDNAVMITDPEGEIEWINRGFTKLYGWKYDEAIQEFDGKLCKFSNKDNLEELIEKCVKDKKFVKYECRSLTKDGERIWTQTTLSPIFDKDGEVRKLITVDSDITELVKARKEAEQANRAKSKFVANVSHEIRTPMNSILGFSELLITDESDSEKLDNIYAIKQAGSSLLNLINDILDLSKIESNKLEIDNQTFDVLETIDTVENMFKPRADQKGLDFKVFISESLPQFLIGDAKRLKQILINIIGNAIKYTIKGRVAVHSYYQKDNLVLSVEDTGIGIPEDKIDELFKPFNQVKSKETAGILGTGLGLAITMRLIKLMHGTIDVESELGKGSVFTIKLPLEIDASREEEANNKKLQVGIVDDSKEYIKIMKKMIERERGELYELPNQETIIDEVNNFKIDDIIVIDYYMPGLNGHEVNKMLKQSTKTVHIPTILCTATESANNAIYHGFDDYVEKPVTKKEIWDKLDNTIEKARQSKILTIYGSRAISDSFIHDMFDDNYRIFYYQDLRELFKDVEEGLQTDLAIIELAEDEQDIVETIEDKFVQLPVIFLPVDDFTAGFIRRLQKLSIGVFTIYDSIENDLKYFIDNYLGKNESDMKELVDRWIGDFMKSTGDDPEFRAMLLEYMVEMIDQINELEIEVNCGNPEAIENASHKLKGNAGNYHIKEISQYSSEICEIVRQTQEQEVAGKNLMKIFIQLKALYWGLPEKYLNGNYLQKHDQGKSSCKILVADDAKMNRKLMEKYLNKFNLDCDFATNGKEVLEQLDEKQYLLLFLDIKMPVMDGMEVLEHLGEQDNHDDLKVVALTANVMKGDRERYTAAGCDDYLPKPLDMNDLKTKLRNYGLLE